MPSDNNIRPPCCTLINPLDGKEINIKTMKNTDFQPKSDTK